MRVEWLEIAESLGYASREEMLRGMYETMGCKAMGDVIGVDRMVVKYHLRKLGVEMRGPGGYHGRRKKADAVKSTA